MKAQHPAWRERTAATSAPSTPRVRAVVLNYNGGELTIACLRSLAETEWPRDALEIVLVDNASRDGVVERVRQELPGVAVIESGRNLGYAGGCNLALRDLAGVDHVALVNNDVTVESGWLKPLVDTLTSDATIGAACPKILLAWPYHELTLEAETHCRGRGDSRRLGVRVSGARVDGADVWPRTRLREGFWGFEPDKEAGQWSGSRAVVLAPAEPRTGGRVCELQLASDWPTTVKISAGTRSVNVRVGIEPAWYRVPLDREPSDVVNNAGSVLTVDGHGADRGYLEDDAGQYDRSEDVFAWCGAAVVLRAAYLEQVGLFDERFFAYYEDLELSWRGHENGWRYRYVPASVVRHVHSATTRSGSELHTYFGERNRLLALTRHAPAGDVTRAAVRYLYATASYARRDVVSPLLHGRSPQSRLVALRLRAFAGYLRLAPAMARQRRRRRARTRLASSRNRPSRT